MTDDPPPDPEVALVAAAFGPEPGRWPLPAASTPHQRWLRAVAAGGQGRYATAAAELAALSRGITAGPLASLALSTQASFLRQLGGHDRARTLDGHAYALGHGHPEAAADAVVGLAADALGVGRFAASAALLGRARDLADVPRRAAVRREWVSAELAMVTGDPAAVGYARRALELTDEAMVRHRVKSQVVLAGALCSVGSREEARAVADAALMGTDQGLIPLRWALACLLIDLDGTAGATRTVEQLRQLRDEAAMLVGHRGGRWAVPQR